MAKETYQSLQAQIRKLQEKAETVRLKQRQPIVASILRSMQEYSITLDELKAAQAKGVSGRKRSVGTAKPAAKAPARQVAPKYRHPETGETWTGRGKPPRWLVAAEGAGATRDQFLIAQ
ncbi:H-NS histone family protein [Pigmentiphaga humi]|uniref:H-NS histone family protein n=1 Tax=Pigmentiphaga humi TaxID=2478468 RepID=A0A3P4B9Y8_9BURK|nr:H-NS histone family protein [Pigmentiphaga humi]VCU72548.1 H-NS histone family protein [Pigmentiphaga humi]